MSGQRYRDPKQDLLRDAVRAKEARNAARAESAQKSVLIDEMRAEIIASYLTGRLRRLEDFHTFIRIENVVGPDGRLDRRELELRVADLLNRRPELAAPGAVIEPVG